MKTKKYFIIAFLFIPIVLFGIQPEKLDSLPAFSLSQNIKTTSVKNQYKTNTCWSYSVLGMLESELIKEGKGSVNLSEMFIVYNTYIDKAERYFRMQGKINFSGGGSLSDPLGVIKKHGIVPIEAYSGLINGSKYPDHFKMDAVLKSYVDSIIIKKSITNHWREPFVAILDKYMGKIPSTFVYNNTTYTPLSYAQSLDIRIENYEMFSSFIYKPYYCRFVVEVPDNWSLGMAFNLPMDELIAIIDNSLKNGYSVAVAIDISEKGFQWDKGLATFEYPDSIKSKKFDAVFRQEAFDRYETTDDHGLQITGKATDKDGNKYYLVKNSWGTEGTAYEGYIYMSEEYLKNKLITVMVNKKNLLETVKEKLDPCCIQ